MATFEINGKEYELKLTYQSVKRLNKLYEGGTYELIGRALQGDIEMFPHVLQAALLHTGENFSLKTIEERVEELIANEQLTFDDISKIINEVVTNSFFYKPTVQRLVKRDPEAKKLIEEILS